MYHHPCTSFFLLGVQFLHNFLGGRGTWTKSGQWGEEGWTVFRFKCEEGLVKKDGDLSHSFWKTKCMPWHHDITKSADSQPNINFSENDSITAEILQNLYQTNEFRLRILVHKKVFGKSQIVWRQMLVASRLSRSKFW